MFIGEFEYRVDEKGRVPIPPKFRIELKEEGVVLAQGMDKCINIYPLSEWNKIASSLTSSPIIQSKLRRLNRTLFSSAFNAEIDAQGRISVPGKLKQYAGISDEVVIAGVSAYLELWSKVQWEAERATSQSEIWQTIESLEKR
jgi:MraZ protein